MRGENHQSTTNAKADNESCRSHGRLPWLHSSMASQCGKSRIQSECINGELMKYWTRQHLFPVGYQEVMILMGVFEALISNLLYVVIFVKRKKIQQLLRSAVNTTFPLQRH
jgi:hypothetical protein